MILALLLSTTSFADQEELQASRECRLEFTAVVPVQGSTDVPIDTLVRVYAQGDSCGNEPIILNIDEGGTILDPLTVDGIAGEWAEYPELELEADTLYTLNFSVSNNSLDVQFTTGSGLAEDPVAPTFSLDSLGAVETEGQLGIYLDAQVSGSVADTSGNTTLRVVLEDRVDQQLPATAGNVEGVIQWVEEELPAEVCMTATAVAPNGVESDPVTDCIVPDYTFIDNPEQSGCNCASTGSAGWWILGLIPALSYRRRR